MIKVTAPQQGSKPPRRPEIAKQTLKMSHKYMGVSFLKKDEKTSLWELINACEFDFSRITIAEQELNADFLQLWLEDQYDFKHTLDECLMLNIPLKAFAKVITDENLNSYEGTKMHPVKQFIYKTRIIINEPVKWYLEDASATEQKWALEAMIKSVITALIDRGEEVSHGS